jgi:anti-sigma-K factor RskA
MLAARTAAGAEASDPMDLTRREIERWRNHFADLDAAAEELSDELRLSNADIGCRAGRAAAPEAPVVTADPAG